MSAADLHDLELVWPSLDPTAVVVTGTFDKWSSSVRLVKGHDGFSATVKVPRGQKVAYKFIVDGRWRCRDDRPQEDDGHGNVNNVLRTPEKPQPAAEHDLPALAIPAQGEGYGDAENMVTAVEFLPPADPNMIKGPFPFQIPQITVDGLAQSPSADSPVSELRLNTAAATEGHRDVFSALDTPAKLSGLASLPSVNGNGEPHDSSFPGASEAAMDAVIASESAVTRPAQAAQDTPAPIDRVDVPPTTTPAAEPQSRGDLESIQPTATPASIGQVSVPSTPDSSTLTHKKRRSLLARIKHVFDKKSKH